MPIISQNYIYVNFSKLKEREGEGGGRKERDRGQSQVRGKGRLLSMDYMRSNFYTISSFNMHNNPVREVVFITLYERRN